MHVEIQVALNFLISFLYNKLPRRRVNQFGEELENALKMKFEGHWYPEKPYKGSAFRCLKTTPPLDPVFEIAAREAGMDLSDIQENLAPELSIWIDPGEVSYRMSEKGPVKILYSESDRILDPDNPDGREVTRTFNPEAQCFKPIDANGLANSFGSLSMSTGLNNATNGCAPSHSISPSGVSSAPVIPFGGSSPIYKANGSGSTGGSGFISKSSNPVTFTTATFAQTKFGSTKLKTNGKRSHRMSPTEFSNYIKQRAMIQQQQAAAAVAAVAGVSSPSSAGIGGGSHNGGMIVNSGTNCGTNGFSNGSPHASRSISPVTSPLDSMSNFMLLAAATGDSPGLNPSGGHHQQQQQPQHHSHNHHQQSATQSSSVAASGYPPGNQYSGRMVSSPISSRNPFSNAMFDNNCLIDLLGTNIAKSGNQPQQQQQQPQQGSALNRFASFLDKAGPYVGTNSSGAASPPHTSVSSASSALANSLLIGNGLSGSGSVLGSGYGGYNDESPTSTSPNLLNNNNHSHNNAAKNGSSSPPSDSFTFNLNSVSYPNQYQHLLMAN